MYIKSFEFYKVNSDWFNPYLPLHCSNYFKKMFKLKLKIYQMLFNICLIKLCFLRFKNVIKCFFLYSAWPWRSVGT